MRVLMVTLGLPYPPDSGTRIRDFNILRQLSSRFKVCLCSLLTEELPPNSEELRQYCETIETFRPSSAFAPWAALFRGWGHSRPLATRPYYFQGMAEKIQHILESRSVDLVQIEHSFLACYRDAIPPESVCRTILSFHNLGSLQYRRIASLKTGILPQLGFMAKAALMRGWEGKIASCFDRSLVVSGKERDLLQVENPALHVSVIENGVDCERFQPLPEPSLGANLLFLGVLSYPPNTDGVLWFTREIWPQIRGQMPGAKLNIAGHSPPAAMQRLNSIEGVSVKGFVKEPLTLYGGSSVVIVPLRAGGGTRLKILEAMAFGRLVVSTSVGCEGLEVVSGEHLIVADTPHDFAAGVVRALNDPELRQRITAKARKLVETHYSWENIGRKLVDVYLETCSEGVRCS